MLTYGDYMRERIQEIQDNERVLTRILNEERKRFLNECSQIKENSTKKIKEIECQRDIELNRLHNIENNCDNLIETIKDNVYFKHIKRFSKPSEVSIDVEDDVREFSLNLDYLNNGKIPPWISNVIYVLNHHWKEELSRHIFELYWRIKNYCNLTVKKANEDCYNSIANVQKRENEKILSIKKAICDAVNTEIKDSTNKFIQILQR